MRLPCGCIPETINDFIDVPSRYVYNFESKEKR